MGDKIHVIGGGTFSHVRNHLALAAPAFGETAREIYSQIFRAVTKQIEDEIGHDVIRSHDQAMRKAGERVKLHLTKMAAPRQSNLVTNEDVEALIDQLIADPDTRVIVMNAAICDYVGDIFKVDYTNGSLGEVYVPVERGKYAERLKTDHGVADMRLTPANKLIGKIRKERKDIFLVGFKTTAGATSDEQYIAGLHGLKGASQNLVLANDTVTRNNIIVTPEESRVFEGTDRDAAIARLVEVIMARSTNTFTRSTVVPGEPVPWDSPMVPENLRKVVDHCIERGAYKEFRGATVGHFAFRVDDKTIITSKRKSNFNDLREIGMVKIEYDGDDKVIAFGAKPSVGGQSQRIIFKEYDDVDCIVHFHCPMKEDAELGRNYIPVAPQWQNECGSHQCGQNTADHLESILFETTEGKEFDDHQAFLNRSLRVVMLDNHGPNIAFSRLADPDIVIDFIEKNFDLSQKTGGLVA